MTPLIKWPGGKAREIQYIERLIPSYDRYIEPFFGGGALFFHLKPPRAVINDISPDLMQFYSLVQAQDAALRGYLLDYCALFEQLPLACAAEWDAIAAVYQSVKEEREPAELAVATASLIRRVCEKLPEDATSALIPDENAFRAQMAASVLDKLRRTIKNDAKQPFSDADLRENLITGFFSGMYLYFRGLYNAVALSQTEADAPWRTANFYFIRETCYGAMFRYNAKGEFNIPYGGMSYNRKNLRAKVEEIFSTETAALFHGTELHCEDFEAFFSNVSLTDRDFLFLDPPYDTDFSEYEGNSFSQLDQIRLAEALRKTKAQFILVIKNTPFISSVYEDSFSVLSFDKTYSYNVRSRNNRASEHLIVTNIPIETK